LNYGDIIRDTFWITLRNRYLWFFGFFAGGGAGSFNYTSPPSGSGGDFEGRDLRVLDTALALALQEGRRWALDNLTLIAVGAAIALLLFLLFFALSLISTGALAESVAAIDRAHRRVRSLRAGHNPGRRGLLYRRARGGRRSRPDPGCLLYRGYGLPRHLQSLLLDACLSAADGQGRRAGVRWSDTPAYRKVRGR
jgi:hypothetical protein